MRLSDSATYMLVTDHGRDPDWGAGLKYLEDVPTEELYEKGELGAVLLEDADGNYLGDDGKTVLSPEEAAAAARKALRESAEQIESSWENWDSVVDYEVRQVRDADVHILYDYWDDPQGLWPAADALEAAAPGWFGAVGFDQ